MGCDIHMYVEYQNKEGRKDYWRDFGEKFNPGRNYWLFGLISKGVRCEFKESLTPKGMPDNPAYSSKNDNLIYICDSDNEGYCTLEEAKEWESYGSKIIYIDSKPTWVEHPDWHSHTWLTIEEYENVLKVYNEKADKEYEPEYEAVLAAMKKLEEFNTNVRIVVWFDN